MAANLDQCWKLPCVEQSGFFKLPIACATVSRDIRLEGHLRVTFTLVAERSGGGTVTTCSNDFSLFRPGIEHPTFLMGGQHSNQHRNRRDEKRRMFYYTLYSQVLNVHIVKS